MIAFDVKCPRCGGRAAATVRRGGVAGTYREPLARPVAERLVCGGCGYNVVSDEPVPYELWYKVSIGGRTAWANNREHARFLVAYPRDEVPPREVSRVAVETLPGWMLEPKHRKAVAERLQRMLEE